MTFLGFYGSCAFDIPERPVLNESYAQNQAMTIQMCLSICQAGNYNFSGLKRQDECHCGNASANEFNFTWPASCNQICKGDSNQFCGGIDTISVWNSQIPTPLDGTCIYDDPNDRVLNNSMMEIKNLTIENCREICKGNENYIIDISLNLYFILSL